MPNSVAELKLTEPQKCEAVRRRDCRRRGVARDSPQLKRVAQHDFPTNRATGEPFLTTKRLQGDEMKLLDPAAWNRVSWGLLH
jgi:hypothetical protein